MLADRALTTRRSASLVVDGEVERGHLDMRHGRHPRLANPSGLQVATWMKLRCTGGSSTRKVSAPIRRSISKLLVLTNWPVLTGPRADGLVGCDEPLERDARLANDEL